MAAANGLDKLSKASSQTSTGRGRKPNWLGDAVKKGAKIGPI